MVFPHTRRLRHPAGRAGFRVDSIALIPRPTPLPGDILVIWKLCSQFFSRLLRRSSQRLSAEVRTILEPQLRDAMEPGLPTTCGSASRQPKLATDTECRERWDRPGGAWKLISQSNSELTTKPWNCPGPPDGWRPALLRPEAPTGTSAQRRRGQPRSGAGRVSRRHKLARRHSRNREV